MDISVVLNTMLKLLILLALGFALFKIGIFDEHTNKKLSSFVVNVASPLLTIYSVSTITDSNRSLIIKLLGCSFVMYLGFVILAKIISLVLPVEKKDKPIYECMLVFANTGFMGTPVLLELYGPQAVFYSSMLHTAFNFFVYTYGVICLTKNSSEKFKFDYHFLFTPGIIFSVLAIVIYLCDIKLPLLITDVCNTLGSISPALSMMMIGSSLATYPVIKCLSDWHSYMFAPVRLFLVSFVTMLICRLLNIDTYFSNIAIITNAMPVGSMVLMLATKYDANVEVVTKNIIVSTVLSIATIPVVVSLFLL